MKYLDRYDGEVDGFEEFMRDAIAKREAEKKANTPAPVAPKTDSFKVKKELKDVARIISYDKDSSKIVISLNGKEYTYYNASPFIKDDLLKCIKFNKKGSFFKTLNFLKG